MRVLEFLVGKFKRNRSSGAYFKCRKSLVELQTEFGVVSGTIISIKAFATFQILASEILESRSSFDIS